MVKSIFSLLSSRQTSILSGAFIIMATVVISRILGLVRDRLLVQIFSPDDVAIFIAASKWPEVIFQLLVFGALSVAFIPVFTETLEKQGKSEAFKLARSILFVSLVLFGISSLGMFVFIDPLVELIVPGFDAQQKNQVARLTEIILIGHIILTVGALFVGILHSFQRFIIPALAGVVYNLGVILGVLLFSENFGIQAAAYGVIIGAIIHALIQLPLVFSSGFRPSWKIDLFHPGTKEIAQLMSFRSLGLAAEHINELVNIHLASLISTASLTYLNFAQRLEMVPVGLFGATIAQAALPVLSSERARGRIEEFKITLVTTIHQILFLTLPAAAILIVLRIPAVRLVFGASQYDWFDTVLTGQTLAYMSIGLVAQSVSLLLIRAFYALKDTKTPVVISGITVATNILLSIYFTKTLGFDVWGLGLSFAIASIISAVLLFIGIHYKVGRFDLGLVIRPFLKMLMATIIMGVSLYIPVKLLDQVIFDTTRTINLLALTSIASVFALSIYVLLVWFLKVRELDTYVELLKKIGKFQTKIKSEEIIHETDAV